MRPRHIVLAELVADRMHELGLSVRRAAALSRELDPAGRGVSSRTWAVLRSGEDDREPHGRTCTLVERTLRWERGTVRAVLAGEVDEPRDADEGGVTLADLAEQVNALRRQVSQMRRAFETATGD